MSLPRDTTRAKHCDQLSRSSCSSFRDQRYLPLSPAASNSHPPVGRSTAPPLPCLSPSCHETKWDETALHKDGSQANAHTTSQKAHSRSKLPCYQSASANLTLPSPMQALKADSTQLQEREPSHTVCPWSSFRLPFSCIDVVPDSGCHPNAKWHDRATLHTSSSNRQSRSVGLQAPYAKSSQRAVSHFVLFIFEGFSFTFVRRVRKT